ncbi:hypothetical protein Hamer_G004869 [Homarus americanus]|uniref:Uncharacterized protein n=1 Tax=Homarus americanus TaxID=6706 RepID=A0A8J5K068_HOMAM|nr:hypothetical protein Hamer_G004869 [Homarus americanus]
MVLYGYPVVVANQQQQQPPPPLPQHCYGKRKKKKYQRRRHADVPAAGGYLDPQLYTGEPFVATPGGYVVPIEAAASVCQVHGLQYVTSPAFHQHPSDEGFVSVQHSPYLPEVATEPPSAEVQQPEGTSQDEASKTVFSDLQDTERRQIQEILQERAKVGKSDSTESSDSGVSESEETAAAELSCDELETLKQQTSQASASSVSEEYTTDVNSSTTLPCQEGISSSNLERVVPEVVSQKDGTEKSIPESDITQTQEDSTGELNNAQHHITDGISSVTVETNDNHTELSDINTQELTCTETLHTSHLDGCISSQSPVSSTEVRSIQRNFQGTDEVNLAESYNHGPEVETVSLEFQVRDKFETPDEVTNEKVLQDKVTENEIIYFDASLATANTECESVDESAIDKTANNFKELPEGVQEFEINHSENSLVLKADDLIDKVVEENSLAATTLQEKSEIYNKVKTVELLTEFISPLTLSKEEALSSSKVINLDAKNSHEIVEHEENSIVTESENGVTVNQRSKCNLKDGDNDENGIDRASFKDLKVTEAVKRWIREVTPEKAFSLTEEVQTRLLSDQVLFEEMDTEDEYIEDEISEDAKSITVMEPKNVKGNPFVAASSDVPNVGMESCGKRVAVMNRLRETTPDTLDEYDGASTISNLSYDHLYSEASSSHPASINHSFDDEEMDKYSENPDIYNPTSYTKYYQLGVELDETTPVPTPPPMNEQRSREATPTAQDKSETVSECGSEDVETIPHKYEVTNQQHTGTSPMSLATEILKAEKVFNNMAHIAGAQQDLAMAEECFGNPDIYLKHYGAASHGEVGDSGVQSEESSDETEARSNVSSSGIGSSLASTPAISPAHFLSGRPPLQPHPLKNLSAREGPVPCRTVCCAVM